MQKKTTQQKHRLGKAFAILLLLFILTSSFNQSAALTKTSASSANTATVKQNPIYLSQGNAGTSSVTSTRDYASVSLTASYSFYQYSSSSGSAATLGIDGTATGISAGKKTTLTTNSLTTAYSNDIIYLIVSIHSTAAVTSITNSGGTTLSWTQRGTITDSVSSLETWYTKATAPFSGTITINIGGSNTEIVALAFGVSGANFADPFDPNLTSPVTATGTGSSSKASITTTNPNNLLIGAVGGWMSTKTITAGTGLSLISATPPTQGSEIAQGEYKVVSIPQSSTQISFSLSGNKATDRWAMVADAIKGITTTIVGSTDFTVPTTSGSYTLSPGQSATLYSPAFPRQTTIYAGSWRLNLWASATTSGTLSVSFAAVDSSNNIISSATSGTASIGTTKSEVQTMLTGTQITVPSGGRILATITNPTETSQTFTIYWGSGQATYFQTPQDYNYTLTITNSGTAPQYISLSAFSHSDLSKLTSMTITLYSPSTDQITASNGILTQPSGPKATIQAGTTMYIRINAAANTFTTANMIIQIKQSASSGPFTNSYVDLNIT